MNDASELGIHGTSPGVVARVALGFAGLGVVTVVVLRQNGLACAPVLLASHERVLVRVIVMHFEHQVARYFVLREGAHRSVGDRLVDVGVEPLNDQGTRGIVAARGADCVNEGLVVVHQRAYVLRRPGVDIGTWFVGACKKQTFVVVLELVCNLRPVSFHLVVDVVVNACADVALEPAAFTFVVNVQNRVEACTHGVINHSFYGIEPGFGNLAAARVAVPSAGDTDRVEACRLYGVKQSLGRVGVAPGGGVVRHFHRVSDVKAHAHFGLDFLRGGERRCCCRKGSCEGKEGGFGKNMLHFRSFFKIR